MFCPFKLVIRQGQMYYDPAKTTTANNNFRFIECDKEQCAWWIDKFGKCAVADIAESLAIMTDYK